MGERVGGERDEADEAPAQPPAEMTERDLVVPGERAIGGGGRSGGERPAQRRNRADRILNLGERETAQLLEQQPGRECHRPEADDRPQDVDHPFHARSAPGAPAPDAPALSLHERGGGRKASNRLVALTGIPRSPSRRRPPRPSGTRRRSPRRRSRAGAAARAALCGRGNKGKPSTTGSSTALATPAAIDRLTRLAPEATSAPPAASSSAIAP